MLGPADTAVGTEGVEKAAAAEAEVPEVQVAQEAYVVLEAPAVAGAAAAPVHLGCPDPTG